MEKREPTLIKVSPFCGGGVGTGEREADTHTETDFFSVLVLLCMTRITLDDFSYSIATNSALS